MKLLVLGLASVLACQTTSVGLQPWPLLPGTQNAALGPFASVNRDRVRQDLLAELARFDSSSDTLQLSADYVAGSEVAANALADWIKRLEPDTEEPGPPIPLRRLNVAINPPSSGEVSAQVGWPGAWAVTIRSRPGLVQPPDVARWARLLSDVAIDARWRLVDYHVGRPR